MNPANQLPLPSPDEIRSRLATIAREQIVLRSLLKTLVRTGSCNNQRLLQPERQVVAS
jgi:hypothetical protein